MAAEKNFENRVKKFLDDEGCWCVKFFANAYTKAGIPDLLVCCHGFFIGVELKAPKGKPSPLQLWNREQIIKAGGFSVILYPDDFCAFKEMILCLKQCQTIEAAMCADKINERTVMKDANVPQPG